MYFFKHKASCIHIFLRVILLFNLAIQTKNMIENCVSSCDLSMNIIIHNITIIKIIFMWKLNNLTVYLLISVMV